MAYHVFISYRRDGGDAMARLIYDRLKAEGYDPFFDVEQMRSGKFNDQLYARIAECEDFILVLPPNSLDRCVNADDWVRLEIQEALRLKKNIIPFMLRDFTFPDNMPDEIDEIKQYQGVVASQDYFDSTFERLKGLLDYRPKRQEPTPRRNMGLLLTVALCAAVIVGLACGLLWFAGKDGAENGTEQPEPTAVVSDVTGDEAEQSEVDYYIGNASRKRFHEPDCESVTQMKEKNRVILLTREEAIEKGYKPCGECNP